MKKNSFKRILSFFLAAVMLFGMLPAVFAQDADTNDVDYAITNPYAAVDWKNYGQYKASLHNHSIVSDGDNDFKYVIETYYSMGYDILAITDHGTVDRGWTEPNYVPALQLALGFRRENGFEKPTGLTQGRYNQITSGSDRGGRGMLRVPYGIENNPTSFNNSHVNSWFVDYGNGVLGGTSDYETPIKNVEALGGLSVINHPGEYTGARNEKDFDKAYNEDYDYDINKFARLLKMYPSCLGIDVNSKGDYRTRHDRKLWDILLQKVVPSGRNVFAFASSDAHRLSAMDNGWTIMLMPSNTVDNLKECMKQGAFFAGSRYIKNTPELEQFSKEVGYNVADENGQWYASPDLVQPVITNIAVDDKEDTIAITAENYLTIHWIADGKVIHVGSEIDLDDYSDEIGSYVRAEVFGEGGILYTQAFTLDYDGAPEAENKFFFDWGNVVKLFADTILYVCGKSELFCKIWFALTHNDAFAK